MSNWQRDILVQRKEELEHINMIIRNGIFQEDALNALWFCIGMNPLSTALNIQGVGYPIPGGFKINLLMYINDIKLTWILRVD